VGATVGSGDSGLPVFAVTTGDSVNLPGISWGGSGAGPATSPSGRSARSTPRPATSQPS